MGVVKPLTAEQKTLAARNVGLAFSVAATLHLRHPYVDYDLFLSECFLSLVRCARGWDGVRRFSAYAASAMRHDAVNLVKRLMRRSTIELTGDELSRNSVLRSVLGVEALRIARTEQPLLVSMFEADHRTMGKDVAALLGCSEVKLSKLRGNLKRALENST